ncbi:MAG: MBL fold metallo-hydrolase [Hyphomicrobiales bacterium]|nr:MBL fold metallo-hydrolase [Hyphomicrobiales bacterium]
MPYRATILGCGSSPGVPRIGNDWGACDPDEPRNRRSRCALLIERVGDGSRPTRVLVDTGPDIRPQLLAADVDNVDGVIYTHAHADHLHGIDDLRAFWLNSRKLVELYADPATAERIEQAFAYCLAAPAAGLYPPILHLNRIAPYEPFAIDGPGGPVAIQPFEQDHGPGVSLGFRFGTLAYSCDVSALTAKSVAMLDGLDTWIVGALRRQPHPSHFTVAQALDWIERLRPAHSILTHMNNDLDYQTLKDELPENVEPGYDGMQITYGFRNVQDEKVP